ncbi:hypothetical protein PWY87_34060 [Kribbella solani]|uniref:hypothetical protein n=1 Tax=Kribbella solani TaxID=236067 RepID=UPI0029A7316C|nr:hypothetical protein [Kribbella solani]MDX3006742.1 hypothetical protein [Kribbella solani]
MALTATYDPVLSRIRLSADLLGATATRCVFWRTTNGFVSYDTVRGGWPVTVNSQNASLDDYEWTPGVATTYRVQSYTAANLTAVATYDVTITQDLTSVWLKVPAAPYLNTPVQVLDRSEVTRRSRAGVFDVVGRSRPVMVGDVASSRSYTVQLLTESATEESNLDYLFASGEVVFVQLPSTVSYIPGGYFSVGDTASVPFDKGGDVAPLRRWSVPLTEVAAPGPAVIGPVYTWTSVLNDYPTWTALLAANATWSDLLQRTSTPSDVIVP